MRNNATNMFTGAMDSDVDERLIQPGDYIYAINILNGSASRPGAVIPMPGTELQSYTLPSGTNICIGAIEDKVKGSMIYFVWNLNENHRILRWFQQSKTIVEIAAGSKLNFDRYSRVQGYVLDGVWMHWTEAKVNDMVIEGNEPRKINLEKAANAGKNLEYELYAGFDGQGQFANGDQFVFNVRSLDGATLYATQTITIPDGTYLSDVQAGLEYLYDQLTSGTMDEHLTVELCDCKLGITALVAERKVTMVVTGSVKPILVPRNHYGPQVTDKETYHFALKKETFDCPPDPEYIGVDDIAYNNVRDDCFQFRARFVYDDGGASHWSGVSIVPLNNAQFADPQPSLNAIKIDYTDERLNTISWLSILDYVDIAFRYNENDVWRLIRRIPVCEVGIDEQFIIFANDNSYTVVESDDPSVATGDTQVLTNYHRVPYKAAAIAAVAADDGNVRNVLSCIQEGQTCPTCVVGTVDAVVYDDEELIDITGTVEIINDPDASDTSINFPYYSDDDGALNGITGGLNGFVVYLAGTPYYGISDNPPDGSGTGRFTIKNVPKGQYILRVASYACRYGDNLGSQYNLLNGIEWQKTSSPVIDCAGSLSDTTLPYERVLNLYGFADPEFDLDVEVGYGTIQIQNYHVCPKTSNPSESFVFFEIHCLDSDGLFDTFEARKAATSVENLQVDFWAGDDLSYSDLQKSTRTDHNGYAWIVADSGGGTKLRPVVSSWGGDSSASAQPYHLYLSQSTHGWRDITDENNNSLQDRNDDEVGTSINSKGLSGTQPNGFLMGFVFNSDPAWTTANQGRVRGAVVDSNGVGLSDVLVWMGTNGRTTRTNQFGEYSLLLYAYDGLAARAAIQDLRVTYLADATGDNAPTPLNNTTAFNIPADSPYTAPDFAFGFAGGIIFDERFLKAGGNYKIGIVYEDGAGRSPCGVTPFQSVRIPFHTQDGQYLPRQLEWTIDSRPPAWATRFRIVRTKDSFYQTYRHLPVAKVQYARIPENATDINIVTYSSGTATHVMLGIRTQIPKDPNVVPTLLMFRDNIQDGYTSKFGDRCRYMLDEEQTTVFSDSLLEVRVEGEYIDGQDYWVIIPYTDIQREIVPGWVFEFFTPKGFDEEIYYETGYCYELLTAPLRHSGDIQDQELGLTPQPARGKVFSGDTYWRLQQFETSNNDGVVLITETETKNRFVDKRCEDIGRPFAVDSGLDEQVFTNRIRFSGLYVPQSRINNLSSFGALDFQSLNRTFGPIKWTGMVHNVMLVICQNKTQPVYVGKGRVLDLAGQTLVGRSDAVLTIADETVADAGTLNPESAVAHDGLCFWWDLQRGTVWRYGPNGVQPFVAGKVNYFRARHDERINLDRNVDICPGGIDRRHDKYFLTFGLEFYLGPEDALIPVLRDTVMLDIEKGRWTSHTDMHGEAFVSVNDDMIVFNNGRAFLAYKGDSNCNFFSTQYEAQIKFAVNQNPQMIKDWLNIRIQSTDKWWAPEIRVPAAPGWPNGMLSRLKPARIVRKQGMYWADFLGDMEDPHTRFTTISDAAERASTALLRGRPLKGDVLIITLETDDATSGDNILFRADVEYADSQNTK